MTKRRLSWLKAAPHAHPARVGSSTGTLFFFFAWADFILDRGWALVWLQSPTAAAAAAAVPFPYPYLGNCDLYHAAPPGFGKGTQARTKQVSRWS